jgi:DNA-binding protein HU-beta
LAGDRQNTPEIRHFLVPPCQADLVNDTANWRSRQLNRRELVAALAERTGTEKKAADAFLSSFTDIVTETVASGDPVAISGFCKFARVERAARMGRNPATGEAIKIAASKKARITPLKAFKDAVLAGK